MIFPKPQKLTVTGTVSLGADIGIVAEGKEAAYITHFFAAKGFRTDAGNIRIKTTRDDSRRMTYVEESRRLTDEKYRVESRETDGGADITVTFAERHGLFHALNTLARFFATGEIFIGSLEDYPLFARRGFIEGFYGKPWTTGERADMLKLMAAHRMNAFYYGPKDDPYHRDKWDELYPEKEFEDLKQLIGLAASLFIDFHFCIAPGLSMRYTDEEDYRALINKIMQIYDGGVKYFGLLLDDIPEQLHYIEDIEKFSGETVNAHIDLANRLYDDLKIIDPAIKLTLCPLQYHGKGNEYFISKLGRGIEAGIDLFWTGRNICSQELTVPEAVTFINATNHKPLYWDNFPVNDAEMVNEMHLGYITGRDPDLYRYAEGLIANCMEYCECSKIPLLTVADYLWNPEGYDCAASWNYAIDTVAGKDSGLFKYFADNLLTSCLKVDNSPMLAGTFMAAQQEFRAGNVMRALGSIAEYKMNLAACCEMLKNGDSKLFNELKPWSRKLILCSEIMDLSFEYLTDPDEDTKAEIEGLLEKFINMPQVLTDFAFKSAVEAVLGGGL